MFLRLTTFILITICFLVKANGQPTFTISANGKTKKIVSDVSGACNQGLVFMVASQMPEYEQGKSKLEEKLNEELEIEKGVKGEISILFTVNCKGLSFGYQVMKSIDIDLDERIVSVLEKTQGWLPGVQGGLEVDCAYVLSAKVKRGKIHLQ